MWMRRRQLSGARWCMECFVALSMVTLFLLVHGSQGLVVPWW